MDIIKLQDIKAVAPGHEIKKILIAGSGSTVSRIFFERLSVDLLSKLKKQNIDGEFEYLGKDSMASKIFNPAEHAGFDAYLVFSPVDSSHFGGIVTSNRGGFSTSALGQVNFSTNNVSFDYLQTFEVKLCTVSDAANPFWNATLFVDGNLSKPRFYTKISKKLYDSFKANGYIR